MGHPEPPDLGCVGTRTNPPRTRDKWACQMRRPTACWLSVGFPKDKRGTLFKERDTQMVDPVLELWLLFSEASGQNSCSILNLFRMTCFLSQLALQNLSFNSEFSGSIDLAKAGHQGLATLQMFKRPMAGWLPANRLGSTGCKMDDAGTVSQLTRRCEM